jgi:hypothetical protein
MKGESMINGRRIAVVTSAYNADRIVQELTDTVDTKISGTVDTRQGGVSVLDGLRAEIRSRGPEWITVALYAAVVAFAIPYHEPWADEAQAWQMARSLPLVALFQKYIRYEGTPGLWHFLLWILSRAHVNFAGMHWVSGGIAVAGISILVLKSPFPRYLKLLLPFTYFLLFQYPVVARSYVLVPCLLFMIAACWKRSPVVVALLLGLLANVAGHATVISGGLASVYAIEQIRHGEFKDSSQRSRFFYGGAILLSLYAFAVWTAWPPHDVGFSLSQGRSRSFTIYAIVSLVWGVCQPWMLSLLFWIAIGLSLYARRGLTYLLPVLLFACFCGAVHVEFWHAGLVIPLVICLLWITWPARGRSVSRYEAIGRGAMIFMAGTQILWSAYALAYDHSHAYSPDLAASKFLEPFVRGGAKIAVTYMDEPFNHSWNAVGILPYFDHNIYMNWPNSFWWWSTNDRTEDLFLAALRTQPRIILVEAHSFHPNQPINLEDPKIKNLAKAGYRLTNVFCGAMWLRSQGVEVVNGCHLIFQHFDQ